MTSSSGRAPARARLAELMDGRRRDLRLKWDEVAARAGIHRETLRQIRIGGGDIRPLSATGIEDALEWERGSVDRILSGGDPALIRDQPVEEEAPPEPTVTELAAEVARLREIVERALGNEPRDEGFGSPGHKAG